MRANAVWYINERIARDNSCAQCCQPSIKERARERRTICEAAGAQVDNHFKLPSNVKVVSNTEGLLGGIKLWQDEAVAKK
jgi:hypothetical protein